jgi:hypothetical protein
MELSLMKHLKQLGLASVMALVATCGVVGSASATVIEPAGTAVTLTSTNSAWAVSGGGSFACTDVAFSGTTPAAGAAATWRTITGMTPTYSGCTMSGFLLVTVTPNEGCHTAATAPQLHLMGSDAATAAGVVTLLSGCSIDIAMPSIGCTLTIAGPQTIGNGTTGTGGMRWTDLATSAMHVNAATVPSVVSNGVGFGCATAGSHTMTLSGTYTRTSATNVTVTP